MTINFSHEFFLDLLLFTLDMPDKVRKPFASSLIFELHLEDDMAYIKSMLNDEPLIFGPCT